MHIKPFFVFRPNRCSVHVPSNARAWTGSWWCAWLDRMCGYVGMSSKHACTCVCAYVRACVCVRECERFASVIVSAFDDELHASLLCIAPILGASSVARVRRNCSTSARRKLRTIIFITGFA
jgi:hypothetical protein